MAERPELAQNMGRDVQIVNGPKGHLAFYGKHKTKGGFRAGIICDADGVGMNNGTIGGHRYFTCKAGQGLLIDPKKVQLLPGGAAEKEVWLKRAKHIKKLNRAFDRLMRSKHLDEFDPTKGAVGVVREEPTDDAPVGKLRINEQSPPTSDAGPLNRPAPAKSDAVRKMEAVLKESRKAVKKGGLNKYSSGVIDAKRERSAELKSVYKEAGSVTTADHYEEKLFRASEATSVEMRERTRIRALEVLTIKEQAEREEQERLQQEKEDAEEAEQEALSAAEEAAMAKAAEDELKQLEKELHADDHLVEAFEIRSGGVSRRSLKKTETRQKVHPMLASVDDFMSSPDEGWVDDE